LEPQKNRTWSAAFNRLTKRKNRTPSSRRASSIVYEHHDDDQQQQHHYHNNNNDDKHDDDNDDDSSTPTISARSFAPVTLKFATLTSSTTIIVMEKNPPASGLDCW